MTSDQRTSLAIIIQLWVVFRLFVSSHLVVRIAILILHLIGLSCFLTSLSWVFTRSSLTRRRLDCWSSSNLSSLTRGSTFKTLTLSSHLSFPFILLFSVSLSGICLSHLCILPPHFNSSQPHPSAFLTLLDSAGRLYQNSNLSGP